MHSQMWCLQINKFSNTVHVYSVVSVFGIESKEDCHKEWMQ